VLGLVELGQRQKNQPLGRKGSLHGRSVAPGRMGRPTRGEPVVVGRASDQENFTVLLKACWQLGVLVASA
jgi:hypothetical protein